MTTMAFANKIGVDVLSRSIACGRRRIILANRQTIVVREFVNHRRRNVHEECHGRSRPSSQYENRCGSTTRNISTAAALSRETRYGTGISCISPATTPAWPRRRQQQQPWHSSQQRHCYNRHASSDGTAATRVAENDDIQPSTNSSARDEEASSSSSSSSNALISSSDAYHHRRVEKKKNESLHSGIHYVLKIPVGKIGKNNLAKAASFLSIVAGWGNERGAILAESLLERLHEEKSAGDNERVVMDSGMYNACMGAWNRSGADGEMIADRVESMMGRMEERCRGDDGDHSRVGGGACRPDRITYNCLIDAYSKREEDSSDEVEGILERMNALAEEEEEKKYSSESNATNDEGRRESPLRPDEITYNSLMNYYATRENDRLAAQRAEDLLLQMSELSQRGRMRMETMSFNVVLKAWSNAGSGMNGARRAEAVLRMMMKLHGRGHENVRPDAVSFSTVISAYSKVDREDASAARDKALELLDEFEGSFILRSDANISSCYNAAANVMVKTGLHDAVDRVKELMDRTKNMDAVAGDRLQTSIVEAYANEGSDESFRRGKELLLEMMDDRDPHREEDSAVPFNILLHAILKGNSARRIERAEELMAAMDEAGGNARPDLRSYNMMISALSRSAAEDPAHERKAVGYMRNMLKAYGGGYEKAKPDSFVFNCVISMLARSKQTEWADDVIHRTLMAMESQVARGNATVSPDAITYNLVIGKLAKAGTKRNAKKVMKLLAGLEERAALANGAAAPDIITYTSVLRMLERTGDPIRAAEVASSYLERAMSSGEGGQLDRLGLRTLLLALSKSGRFDHAYIASRGWAWIENSEGSKREVLHSDLCNLVLVAFGKTNDPKAATEALSFLSERIRRRKEGDETAILPTVIGFSAALASLGRANRTDDALRVLDIMKALCKDGVPNVEPDDGCYNSILSHLARSRGENAAAQAIRVVRHMKENSGRIYTASLNSAINVCSRTNDGNRIARKKAVEIALILFQMGRESKSLDAITFALMIRTCMRLTDDDVARLKLVEPLFKLCAKNGLVGNMVMREIGHLKKSLVANDQLPKEWARNVREG